MSKAAQFREPFSRPMKEQGPSSAVLADEAANLWARDRRPKPTGAEKPRLVNSRLPGQP
jgi:hypothetical protein